ncbi:hypothetical protein F2Q69_00043993 [Brassica cretica]|uniref:Uncharacterized protein n=1 Tax=Brassica cretica TaxID=69181 RepID=A0A8S9NM82_BRACR|nr:hypothetical protein F2Q69_00043993 [Brassica cretica]
MGASRQLSSVRVTVSQVSLPLMVEALALGAALSSVQQLYLSKVWMRSDFQELSRTIIWNSIS